MRYAIISYFDRETERRIREIEERLFEMTGARIARDKWDPHITVGAGVELSDEQFSSFSHKLEKIISKIQAFEVPLKDYGFMDNWTKGAKDGLSPYVIYIDVVVNDKLKELVESIKAHATQGENLYYGELYPEIGAYKPHATVAFGDLDKEHFEEAREVFTQEGFIGTAFIDHVALAKEGEDGKWSEFKRFNLKQ